MANQGTFNLIKSELVLNPRRWKNYPLKVVVFLLFSIWPVNMVCLAEQQPSLKLVIGGDFNYPPYEYTDSHGQPTGYNVELTKAIAKVMEFNFEIQLGPWVEIRNSLEAGKIDAIHGMFYSHERERQVDFTPPHTIVNHAVFARKDSEPVKSLEKLRHKNLIVMRGDIMHDYIVEKNFNENPVLVETQADALRLLASGHHDYALIAKLPGLYWIKKLNLTNIETTGPPIRPSKYCYAVKKGNAVLLAQFAEGLAILKRNGRYREIYEKWLGVLEPPGLETNKVVKIGLLIAAPLVFLLIGFLVWSRMLKKRVKQKTHELEVHLAYEKGLAECSQSLIKEKSSAVTIAIHHLLKCTGVSRVYIFKNFVDEADEFCMCQTHEACAQEVQPEIDNPTLQHLPYNEGFNRWREVLSQGKHIFGLVQSFPKEEQEILQAQGILSILVIPIFVKSEWYGFMGFDDTRILRNWTENDIRLLRTAAELIGIHFERKAFSDSLNRSEEQLRLVLEATNDGIWDWNAVTGEVMFSPRYSSMLGYVPGELSASYKTWEKLLHPEDRERAVETVKHHLESSEQGFEVEFRMKTKDGGWKWILGRGKVVNRLATGEALRIVGTHVDISKLKKTEESLERALEQANGLAVQSEMARLESDQILNTSGDGMCVIGKNFDIIRINDAFCKMADLSESDCLGKKCYNVFPSENCNTNQCPLVQVLKNQNRIESEQEKKRKDGKVVHCIVTATPWKGISGELLGVVEDLKDISERKKAETVLRENKARLQKILDSMQTGIVIVDVKNHIILDANPAALKIIGASKEDIVGKVCHQFICPAEESRCPITDLGKNIGSSEGELIKANGDRLSILKTVVNTVLDGKEVLVESFLDITERKEFERQRLEKEKLEGVIEMAGAVCHELNQPMQAVSTCSELLLADKKRPDPMNENLTIIKQQIHRMGSITKKLMRITKYETKDYVFDGKKIIDIEKASQGGVWRN